MYRIIASSRYRKDFKRLSKSGCFDVKKLEKVIDLLANNRDLPKKCINHPLKGLYKGSFECHIEPDLLLIYEKIEDMLVLYLVRLGSHSDLF